MKLKIKFFSCLLLFFHFSSCKSAQKDVIKDQDKNLLSPLAHDLNITKLKISSRYWMHDDSLIRFITNINEDNQSLTPTVYIHGLGGSIEDYFDMISVLHSSKFLAPYFAFDLPGFGESSTKNSNLTLHKFSLILSEFIKMIQNSSDSAHKKVNLVCHSLGGQICIDFALENSQKINLLTLIAPAGVYERSAYLSETINFYLGIPVGAMGQPHEKSINDLTWYNQEFTQKMLTNNPTILAAIASYKDNFRMRIKNLRTKTLIIWGRQDAIFNYENGFYLKENIQSSILYVLNDADHFPLKTHATFIANIIRKNLEKD